MRWNGVVIGVFSLVALGMLFVALLYLIGAEDKSEAHWGAIMAVLGGIGGFLGGSWTTANMRFDETPPMMPVSDALEFVRLGKSVVSTEEERS